MGWPLAYDGREASINQVNSLSFTYLPIISPSGTKIDHGSDIQTDQRFPLERWGKNQNYMHLVNWEIVKRPVLEGGLQIKDRGMSNQAMEANCFGNYSLIKSIR